MQSHSDKQNEQKINFIIGSKKIINMYLYTTLYFTFPDLYVCCVEFSSFSLAVSFY